MFSSIRSIASSIWASFLFSRSVRISSSSRVRSSDTESRMSPMSCTADSVFAFERRAISRTRSSLFFRSMSLMVFM